MVLNTSYPEKCPEKCTLMQGSLTRLHEDTYD